MDSLRTHKPSFCGRINRKLKWFCSLSCLRNCINWRRRSRRRREGGRRRGHNRKNSLWGVVGATDGEGEGRGTEGGSKEGLGVEGHEGGEGRGREREGRTKGGHKLGGEELLNVGEGGEVGREEREGMGRGEAKRGNRGGDERGFLFFVVVVVVVVVFGGFVKVMDSLVEGGMLFFQKIICVRKGENGGGLVFLFKKGNDGDKDLEKRREKEKGERN